MALETGTYISDLIATNPTSSDAKSQGDDHLRFVKSTVKATFPNVSGAVTPTHTELNYVDGVTSAIQTQLDAKAPLASPVLTGVPEAPTAPAGSNNTQIATTEFVVSTSLTASLPGQTGKDYYLLSTDGATAAWYNTIDTSVVTPVAGTAFATTTATQTLTDKTITDPIIANDADVTKKANFDLSGITAGQNRTITVSDNDIDLDTPGLRYLSTVTASASATVDIETTFDSTYDEYLIIADKIQLTGGGSPNLLCRLKIGGAYISSPTYTYSQTSTTNTTTYVNSSGQSSINVISNNTASGSDSTVLRMMIFNPSDTTVYKGVMWEAMNMAGVGTSSVLNVRGSGYENDLNTALTGVRFLASSGNIDGVFKLYGIRK